MDDSIVKWPFGEASRVVMSAAGAQEIEIVNDFTVVDGASTPATGDRALNVKVPDTVRTGAMLLVKIKTTATEKTTFGDKISGAEITGVAGKTITAFFVHDGNGFVQAGTAVQVD